MNEKKVRQKEYNIKIIINGWASKKHLIAKVSDAHSPNILHILADLEVLNIDRDRIYWKIKNTLKN